MMCAMKIRHQLTYDASPEQVYAMLSDPAFRDKVCAAMDTVKHDVSIDADPKHMSVRIDMVQHTKGVPGFAKKVVGDETRIIQSERWAGGTGADLDLEIPGKPGHIRGRITLTGDGSGTVESFEGEAKVNVPLVGGKLEGLIHKLFIAGMDTEQRVGTRWLAGER
jgi:uncharacterized protein YndB with AHSA1/START domain